MASYVGTLHDALEDIGANRLIYSGRSASIGTPPQWQAEALHGGDLLESLDVLGSGAFTRPAKLAPKRRTFVGTNGLLPGDTFFENVIVRPRAIDLGVILATQVVSIQIYNAYRRAPRVFNAFVNNAGSGISITDLPALPFTIQPQDNLDLTLQVLADGTPVIDGDLLFDFDAHDVPVPITGQRAILFPFEPVKPLVERLQFKTDVIPKKNGKEQRISLRANPRQIFELVLELVGNERRLFESIMFDAIGRALGVPVWFEPALTTSAISPGTTVVNVDSTDFGDFRDGGIAMAFVDERDFEALEILSHTSSSITFATAFTKSFPVGTRIMPVRIALATSGTRGEKMPRNMQRSRLLVTVLDNESSLGSASAFGSFGGKVLLDEPNAVGATLEEGWERQVVVVDGETGIFQTFSDLPNARRSSRKTFVSRTRQRLWEVRRLLHHLRGRQVSFYVPTFFDEMVVTDTIANGSSTFRIENIGYTDFVKSRQSRNVIQLIKNDGTKIARAVASAAEISSLVEELTITGTFPGPIAPADVARVEYFEKVRFDSDEIVIRHGDALGSAEISGPIIAVYE